MTVLERLFSRVEYDTNGGCWLWSGERNQWGYGRFRETRRHPAAAHRRMYELLVGPIPEGLVIDHLCRVTCCVNPAHMEPVTDRVNVLRGVGHTAKNAAKTHCKRGHPFTVENTYNDVRPGGGRRCRACGAEAKRRRDAGRRANGASR